MLTFTSYFLLGLLTFLCRSNAPWGLSRISQNGAVSGGDASALDYSYSYDDTAGEGVDVYVVDTGILTTHEEFEGRASWGATFGGYEVSLLLSYRPARRSDK